MKRKEKKRKNGGLIDKESKGKAPRETKGNQDHSLSEEGRKENFEEMGIPLGSLLCRMGEEQEMTKETLGFLRLPSKAPRETKGNQDHSLSEEGRRKILKKWEPSDWFPIM